MSFDSIQLALVFLLLLILLLSTVMVTAAITLAGIKLLVNIIAAAVAI